MNKQMMNMGELKQAAGGMKRRLAKLTSMILVVIIAVCVISSASACTTFIVGSEVSEDGSHFIGRTGDAPYLWSASVQHVPGRNDAQPLHYVDNDTGMEIDLPAKAYSCLITPLHCEYIAENTWWENGVNEMNVGISSTETINTNDQILAVDPFVDGALSEGNIPVMVLPYVSTAREGAERLMELVHTYGMGSAEAVIFVDENEIWYVELYSGHQCAAYRIPENTYACIGNDAMLSLYDKNDSVNWMATPEIVETAKAAGTYVEEDGKINLALSYGTLKRDYSQLRVWAGRRYFNPSTAGEYDVNRQYDICTEPEMKISLADMFRLSRDRHEGTPQATDLPGSNCRPIGIDRTAESIFIQMKKGETPMMWCSLCAPEFSLYVPMRADTTEIPAVMANEAVTYESDSIYWQQRNIMNIAATDRDAYSSLVRVPFAALEQQWIDRLADMQASDPNVALASTVDEAEAAIKDVTASLITRMAELAVANTKSLGKDQAK